jgi:hypothetical protein
MQYPSNTPTCIYCKRRGVSFDGEHVIPKAFGKFDSNNLVLRNTVCRDCNNFFSRELEQPFSRGSLEAAMRVRYGLKNPSDGNEIRRDRVEFVIPIGEFKGARLYLDASPYNTPYMSYHPQAGFKRASDNGRQFFLLQELQAMPSFKSDNSLRNDAHAIVLINNSKDERDQIFVEFERLKIKFKNALKAVPPTFTRETTLEIRAVVDKISARTIAKIAFNYMAAMMGSERCLHPDFDAVREFIRNGTDPRYQVFACSKQPVLASDSQHWRQTDGHLIALDVANAARQVRAKVSLFNALTYDILLCPRRSNPLLWPTDFGHHFNLRDKIVSELTTSRTLLENIIIPSQRARSILIGGVSWKSR